MAALNFLFMSTPRAKFCWVCGKLLVNDVHMTVYHEGADRICHKTCGKELLKQRSSGYWEFREETKYIMEERDREAIKEWRGDDDF